MANDLEPDRHLARELAVPAIMIGFVALYVWQIRALSFDAMIFPIGLIAVLVVSLLLALMQAIPRRTPLAQEDVSLGPIMSPRPWLLVAGPAVLISLADYLGTPLVLVTIVAGAQLVLGARSIWRSIAIAVLLATPLYILFVKVFYVRFPAGALGLG